MLTWLSPGDPVDRFPPHEAALREPAGLLAAGGDLAPERLIAAYERGIFPWYSPGEPVLWWSPDPREVLFPSEFHCSRSLRRTLRAGILELRWDTAFATVIERCAAPRSGSRGTWITPAMRRAYIELHARGVAHCVETWLGGELVGGLYGLQIGAVFCGESMFSAVADASKAAMAELVARAAERGITLIDCQMPSAHLRSLGSRPIARTQFLAALATPGDLAVPVNK